MKDAKGHGSNKRGGGPATKVALNPATQIGYRVSTVGPGGTEVNVKTGGGWGAKDEAKYQADKASIQASRNSSGQKLLPSASQVPLGKLPGEQGVQASMGALGVAAQHSIPTAHLAPQQRAPTQGGPFKVQALDTKRAGQPWATQKSFRNSTVAETVAKGLRTDGGYTRVKVR